MGAQAFGKNEIVGRYIEVLGFALVDIPPGEKGPKEKGWNKPGGYFTDASVAREYWSKHPDHNVGLLHGPSGTCVLDLDSQHARAALGAVEINLESYLSQPGPKSRGNPDKPPKLFYRVPDGVELRTHKLQWPHPDGPDPETGRPRKICVFELRAGAVQDVLPPSIHPDTRRPYTWLVSPFDEPLPLLPQELTELWVHFPSFLPHLESACPWAPATIPAKPVRKAPKKLNAEHPDVIGAYNAAHDVTVILENYKYKRWGTRRFLAPDSTTKLPGVVMLDDEHCYSHHGSDPLADDHRHDAFDVYRILDHGGDWRAAVKEAATLLGLDARRPGMPTAQPEPSNTSSAPSDCFVLPGNGVTISACAADIFGELARKKTIFVRSGVVCELSTTKHGHALCAVSPAGFRSRIERYKVKGTYAWLKTRHGKLALCPKPCSEDIAKALLASLEARELLPLADLVLATPILVEREGRLEPLGRGYHDRERLLITKGELPPPVELGAAVRSLQDLLSDFLFPTSGDRSRALASLITPALTMGGLLGGYAPIDIAEATAPQSGKGYRQKLTHAVYGETAYTVARREGGVGSIDESLGMALFSGRPFVLIDNIRGLIASQYLESIITFPEQVAVRIPRREEIQVDASRVTFQLTSNGAETTPDLAARSCITRIRKRPPGYKFHEYPEGYLLDHVRKNQRHYLGCVFAVVTEWYAKHKPTIPGSSHDFRDWAGALDWIVQRLFKAAPLLEGHDRAQERVSDPALTWLRQVCVAAAKTNQLGAELSATALLELCEAEAIMLPRRIGTNPGDGAKAIGQALGKLYRDAGGDTLAVDEYEMQRIERKVYDPVERKHREVKCYVIQKTHRENA